MLKTQDFEFYDWRELVDEELEEDIYLMKDILIEGAHHLLHGYSEAGKSLVAMTMATHVLTGTPFLKKHATKKGNVLYVSTTDMTTNQWQIRLKAIDAVLKPDHGRFAMVQYVNNPECTDFLKGFKPEWLEHALGYEPRLVIVDVVADSTDLDPNDQRTPKAVYASWRRLFPSATFLFTHHERKESPNPDHKSPAKDAVIGSSKWISNVAMAMRVEKAKSGIRYLTPTKNRNIPDDQKKPIPIHIEESTLVSIGDNARARAWDLIEEGLDAPSAAKLLAASDKNMSLAKALSLTNEIFEVKEFQAEYLLRGTP